MSSRLASLIYWLQRQSISHWLAVAVGCFEWLASCFCAVRATRLTVHLLRHLADCSDFGCPFLGQFDWAAPIAAHGCVAATAAAEGFGLNLGCGDWRGGGGQDANFGIWSGRQFWDFVCVSLLAF